VLVVLFPFYHLCFTMSPADVHGHQSRGDPPLPRFTKQMSGLLGRVADSAQNRLVLEAKYQLDSHMPTRKDREEGAFTRRPRKKKGPSPLRRWNSMASGKRLSTALATRGGRVLSDHSNISAETFYASSGYSDIPMHVKVAIGDTSVATRYVTDELHPKSSDSEGTNISQNMTAASETPRKGNSPEIYSESVSQRACMPGAFFGQVLMADHTSGRLHSHPGIPPIPKHLIQKDEGAKQALLWESASATTADSKEELKFAGVLALQQQFSPRSFPLYDEAQDPVFDASRQHANEDPCTVFQDAALNFADLVAEFSEDPMAKWGTQQQ